MPDQPYKIWKSDSFTVKLYAHDSSNQSYISTFTSSASFLYNQPAHLRTQTDQKVYSFYLFTSGNSYPPIFIHFSEKTDSQSISPPNSPFGGIEPLEEISVERIHFLLNCIEDWGRSQGLASLSIKLPAVAYHPSIPHLIDLMRLHGYQVQSNLINHHIEISETSFDAIITPAEKRRLKKCKQASFKTSLMPNKRLQDIYQFIAACRQDSGYPLSTPFATLQSLAIRFPGQFSIFSVTDNDKTISTTILLRVCATICYTFLPATDQKYRMFSPMVLLTETLYEYCFRNGIRILDLGTSCDDRGVPKPGLMRFKSNLGGITSDKYTLIRHFG